MAESKLADLANELEGLDDEPTGETNIIVQPGGVVHVEQTGRHQAMTKDEADRVTPTDPKSSALPPKQRFALKVLESIQPPWLRAPVVIFALALIGLLVWKGLVPALAAVAP